MLTLFAILASFYIPSALAQSIVVTDPVGVVQCTTYTITWTGGVPPFEVQVVGPGGDNYGTFTSVVGQSTQWVVNNLGNPPAPSPMPFFIVVTDSTGAEGTSESESIAAGNISLSSGGICASIQGDDSSSSDSGPSSSAPASSPSSTTASSTNPSSPSSPPQSKSASSTGSAPSGAPPSTGSSTSSPASAPSASGTATTTKKITSGEIAGAVVGGVILISLLGTIFGVLRQRHQKAILDDIAENGYHLALYGKNPPPSDVAEKPLPAFYEPIRRESSGSPSTQTASETPYSHDAAPSFPQSGYLPASKSQLMGPAPFPQPQIYGASQQTDVARSFPQSGYNPANQPQLMDPVLIPQRYGAPQQMDLERQLDQRNAAGNEPHAIYSNNVAGPGQRDERGTRAAGNEAGNFPDRQPQGFFSRAFF